MADQSGQGAVLYYSLSGHTRRVAESIAEQTGARLLELTVNRYQMAGLGYARAAFDSLTGSLPRLTNGLLDLSGYDWIALGAPIWTSFPATPLRRFLKEYRRLPPRLGLFVTSGDHSPPKKAFRMCEALADRSFDATLSIPNEMEGSIEAERRLVSFSDALLDQNGAKVAL